MSGRVTIREIADAVGVSCGTISRALKNEPGLTEVTRQKILEAAYELGYDFSKLHKKRIRRVTFLLHRQHNTSSSTPFYSQVLRGASEACRAHGIILSFTAIGPADGLLDQMRLHMPDGIVCAGFIEPETLAALRATGKPLVLIDMKLRGYSSVNPDNFMGGYMATKHLIDTGRTRIGMIYGSLAHYNYGIRERERGYRQALFDAGIMSDPRLEAGLPDGISREAGAVEAIEALLAQRHPPDAVFCYNDSAALVVMRYCLAKGLKVPYDLAIVGFDDIADSIRGQRPLTTVHVDKKALGTLGVELLLTRSHSEPLEKIVSVELIVRGSSVVDGWNIRGLQGKRSAV